MSRADELVLLAKQIASYESDLDEMRASYVVLARELGVDIVVARPSPGSQLGTIQERVLRAFSDGATKTKRDILIAIGGDSTPGAIDCLLSKFAHEGRIVRVRKGVYQLSPPRVAP